MPRAKCLYKVHLYKAFHLQVTLHLFITLNFSVTQRKLKEHF